MIGADDGCAMPIVCSHASTGHEMVTGRKAKYADPVRIEVPLRGASAHEDDGPLRILERHR